MDEVEKKRLKERLSLCQTEAVKNDKFHPKFQQLINNIKYF
jgi:hypothetical protein